MLKATYAIGALVVSAVVFGGSIAVAESTPTTPTNIVEASTPIPIATQGTEANGFANTPSSSGGPKQGVTYGFKTNGDFVFNVALDCSGSERFEAGGPSFSNFAGYKGAYKPRVFSEQLCHSNPGSIISNSIYLDSFFHVCGGVPEIWIKLIGTPFDDVYRIPVPDIPTKVCRYAGIEPYFSSVVQQQQVTPGQPSQPVQPVATTQIPGEEPPKQVYLPGPPLPDSTPTPVPTQ